MAKTPEQIAKDLARVEELYKSLGKENPFKGADPENISKSVSETEKLRNTLAQVTDEADRANQSFSDLYEQLKNTTAEIGKVKTPIQEIQGAFKGTLNEVKKLVQEEKGLTELSMKDLKNIQKRAKLNQDAAEEASKNLLKESGLLDKNGNLIKLSAAQRKKLTDEQKTALGIYTQEDTTLEDINTKIKTRIENEEKIQDALGLGGAALQGFSKTLDKIGLGGLAGRLGLDEANKKMREIAEERLKEVNEETGEVTYRAAELTDQFATLGAGIEVMGSNLAKNLIDPVAIAGGLMGKFVSAVKNADKNIEGIARGMNMTVGESQQFVKELNNAAIQSESYKVNTKALVQANLDINNALGTSVKLNDKNLQTFVKFQNAAGLTSEELQGINGLAIATGGDLKKMTGEFMAQAKITATQNKAVLNEKELLKDISNTSAAIKLSFGGSTKELAKAAATAKSLGMELGKVEDIAGSLLEFESSIEAELEAELLLGKNINLEKARQAALNNDLATVAEEIAKQAGSAADFANMNRIQQEAIASAVGMSRDELASSLFMQEQIGNLSEDEYKLREKQINELQAQGLSQDEIKEKLAKTSIEDLEAQAGLATQFHEASEKINDAFQKVAIALQPVFNMFAGIVTFLAESKILAGALIGTLVAMKAVSTFIAIKTLITSVAKIFGENAKFGPFGIAASIAGVGAMIGAIAMATTKAKSVGDLAIPASGKTMISSKEGGLFELSPNDDVVAAPGAAAAVAGASGASSKRLEELQAQTNALLNKILSTQGTVSLDAEKMGTAISMNTYEISP